MIVLVSRVTAPLRASTRPETVAPVFTVIEVSASTLPTRCEPASSVAELPTCQKTLQAWALFVSVTVLDEAIFSVEPAWNTKTAFGSPPPSRVRLPVSPSEEAEL